VSRTAVLNPDVLPFCLGDDRKVVSIPVYFNATTPVEVELFRTDLESNQLESIKLSRTQLRDIERRVKAQTQEGEHTVVQFDYPAKKPGVYRLGKVLDEYKLRVDRKSPPTFVVPCPRARVGTPSSSTRCIGDLSDVTLQVEGTPPLRIIYGLTINDEQDRSFHFQSLQPDGFTSPLTSAGTLSSALAVGQIDDDISWARPQRVPVVLNESMHTSGAWQYSIDEVQDAFGNIVKYASPVDDPEGKPKPKHLVQSFVVKNRPQVRLKDCDIRNPLKVAKGGSTELPVQFTLSSQSGHIPDDTSHTLKWQFSPIDTLTTSGDHGDVVSAGSFDAKNARDRPRISAPGLYTLKSVNAGSCEGDVQEPSSCLLLNPLEPRLSLRSEDIPDTCAGNSVGLRVELDLDGTPPFTIRYMKVNNGHITTHKHTVDGLRSQLPLKPPNSGHHKLIFTHISDAIYKDQKLTGSEYTLEKDIQAAAAAQMQKSLAKEDACLGDEASVDVLLFGDAPFTLEWELIHDGKRKHQIASNIQETKYTIKSPPLLQGGEYTIALTSVQDRRGCKSPVEREELKVSVRRQSPRAAFGLPSIGRKIMEVEGHTVKLPLRLTGDGPWRISYTNLGDGLQKDTKVFEKTVNNDNDFLEVRERGIYSITDVWDKQCHGVVDTKASTFHVDWHPQPELGVPASHAVARVDGRYVVDAVCEGDVSGFGIEFRGKYQPSQSYYWTQN